LHVLLYEFTSFGEFCTAWSWLNFGAAGAIHTQQQSVWRGEPVNRTKQYPSSGGISRAVRYAHHTLL